jgi:hypothetical protein
MGKKSGCYHLGARFKRLGILREPETGSTYYLLVCQECGSTVSTRTLRARKELRKTYQLNLSLL